MYSTKCPLARRPWYHNPWLHKMLLGLAVVGLSLAGAACSGGGDNGDDSSQAPSAPTGLEATSMDGAIELSWGAVSGAETYQVYRSTSAEVSVSGSPLDTGLPDAGYTDQTAENGTTYYYVVTAVSGEDAESDPSNEVEATPFFTPPERPSS